MRRQFGNKWRNLENDIECYILFGPNRIIYLIKHSCLYGGARKAGQLSQMLYLFNVKSYKCRNIFVTVWMVKTLKNVLTNVLTLISPD